MCLPLTSLITLKNGSPSCDLPNSMRSTRASKLVKWAISVFLISGCPFGFTQGARRFGLPPQRLSPIATPAAEAADCRAHDPGRFLATSSSAGLGRPPRCRATRRVRSRGERAARRGLFGQGRERVRRAAVQIGVGRVPKVERDPSARHRGSNVTRRLKSALNA